jgi:hypothetical protein
MYSARYSKAQYDQPEKLLARRLLFSCIGGIRARPVAKRRAGKFLSQTALVASFIGAGCGQRRGDDNRWG